MKWGDVLPGSILVDYLTTSLVTHVNTWVPRNDVGLIAGITRADIEVCCCVLYDSEQRAFVAEPISHVVGSDWPMHAPFEIIPPST